MGQEELKFKALTEVHMATPWIAGMLRKIH